MTNRTRSKRNPTVNRLRQELKRLPEPEWITPIETTAEPLTADAAETATEFVDGPPERPWGCSAGQDKTTLVIVGHGPNFGVVFGAYPDHYEGLQRALERARGIIEHQSRLMNVELVRAGEFSAEPIVELQRRNGTAVVRYRQGSSGERPVDAGWQEEAENMLALSGEDSQC